MAKLQKVPMSVLAFVEAYGSKPENFSGIVVKCLEGQDVKDVPLTEAEILVADFDALVTRAGQGKALFVTHAMARGIRAMVESGKMPDSVQCLKPEFVLGRVAWAEEIRGEVAPLVETATEVGLSEDELVSGPVGQLADKVHAGADQLKGWFESATPAFEQAHAACQKVWGQIKVAQEADKNAFQRGQDWQSQLEELDSYADYQSAMEQFLEQVGARLDGPVRGIKSPFIKARGGEPCVLKVKRRETAYILLPRVYAVVLAELLYEQHKAWARHMAEKIGPRFRDPAPGFQDFVDMNVHGIMETRSYILRKQEKDKEAASYSEKGFKNPALSGVFSFDGEGNLEVVGKERRDRRGFRGKKDRRDGWGARD